MYSAIRNRLRSKPYLITKFDAIVKFLQNPKKLNKEEYSFLVRNGRLLIHRVIYEYNFGYIDKNFADQLISVVSELNKHLLDKVIKAYIDYYNLIHGKCSLLSCTAPTIILEEILERSLHDIKNNIYEIAFANNKSRMKPSK